MFWYCNVKIVTNIGMIIPLKSIIIQSQKTQQRSIKSKYVINQRFNLENISLGVDPIPPFWKNFTFFKGGGARQPD